MSGDLLNSFSEYIQLDQGLSQKTAKSYFYLLKIFLRYLDGSDIDITQPTSETILNFRKWQFENGRSEATIFNSGIALKRFYRFLIEKGHISSDPTREIKLKKVKRGLPRPLSKLEIDKLLSPPLVDKFNLLRDHVMISLKYDSGLRVSELTGLKIDQLDFDQNMGRVIGKGSKERIFFFSETTKESIKKYLALRNKRFLSAEPFLFLNFRGLPIKPDGFRSRLKSLAKKAGIDGKVTPHRIRHSFASHLLDGGSDLRTLQEMLGHKNITTTQIYTEVSIERKRKTCQECHPRFSNKNI